MNLIRSRTRQEYPHSLSYQAITFTQLPATTRVMGESTMALRGSPLKSLETSSCSSYPRYPFSGAFSDAFFSELLTSSTLVFFSMIADSFTLEALVVGRR